MMARRKYQPQRRSAAALLVNETGRYLMQQRDDFAWINYPDFWGSFGGAVEHFPGLRRAFDEHSPHAHRLGALAGKEEGGFGH